MKQILTKLISTYEIQNKKKKINFTALIKLLSSVFSTFFWGRRSSTKLFNFDNVPCANLIHKS